MKEGQHPAQDPDLGTPRSVWVTGIGVVSPLGNSVHDISERFAAGETAVVSLSEPAGRFGASVESIPLDLVPSPARSHLGRLDRFCRLLLSAAFSAVDAAKIEISPAIAPRVGLSVGTALGCLLTNAEYNQKLVEQGAAAASPRLFAYTVSSAAAGELSIALGIKGPNVTAHQGFAAGLGAVGYGFDLIRMGKADVVLAGGVDALGPALTQGFDAMGLLKMTPGALPFRDEIPGLYPSEGAAVLVLEDAVHARRRGAEPMAVVKGYACGFEPTLTQRDRQATALCETMRRALDRSAVAPVAIESVFTSAHATAVDAVELAAITAVLGRPRVFAPKQAWGECFAAHGVLSTALAVGMMGSTSSPRLALIHALCYSGPTVALVIGREE